MVLGGCDGTGGSGTIAASLLLLLLVVTAGWNCCGGMTGVSGSVMCDGNESGCSRR